MIISSNKYLTLDEMKDNAQHILNSFVALGWSKNAVCGMLGNMQTESTINPGLWESMLEGNMKGGFGLVQWTPATNYTTWADNRGYTWGDINAQIERIQYELENGYQWIETSAHPISFKEFSISNDTPYNLAMAFIANYERPLNPLQPIRGEQAEYWYNLLEGGGTIDPPTTGTVKCTKRWVFGCKDYLLGRKFTSNSKYFKLIKTIGDMAIIEDDNKRRFRVYKNYLKNN